MLLLLVVLGVSTPEADATGLSVGVPATEALAERRTGDALRCSSFLEDPAEGLSEASSAADTSRGLNSAIAVVFLGVAAGAATLPPAPRYLRRWTVMCDMSTNSAGGQIAASAYTASWPG